MVDCQFSAFIKNPAKNVYQTTTFSTNWPDVFEYCAPLDCRCCKNKRKVSVIFLAKIRCQTILYSAEATILDKINGKFIPPLPPKSRMGKWGLMAFGGFILDLGEVGRGFAVPFYFVHDCSFQENCEYYACASTISRHSKSLVDIKH